MKNFLESDNVDVWQVCSDGMADVRINKDLLETTTHAIAHRECTKIANICRGTGTFTCLLLLWMLL